jgi:uncharacterized delta-60 repeat protein
MRTKRLLGLILVASAGLAGREALAALTPDTAYGTGGIVSTYFGGDADEPYVIEIDGNGRAVVAGWTKSASRQDAGVTRLNIDGSADLAFGVNGHVAIRPGAAGTCLASSHALAFQADGKILVAGNCLDSTGDVSDMFVARLLANGTLDNTFDGDGAVIVTRPGGHSGYLSAMALQSSGRILLAGSTGNAYQTGVQIIIALKPDGTTDTGFAAGGVFELHNYGAGAFYDIAVAPDGRIVAAGVSGDLFSLSLTGGIDFTDLLFIRLLADGAVDTTFGSAGFSQINVGDLSAGPGDRSATHDRARGIALRPDGRILVAGQTTLHFDEYDSNANGFVAQLLDNGTLDPAFGTNQGYTRLPDAGSESASAVALLPGGDVVVGGYNMRLAHLSGDGRMIQYTNAPLETSALAAQSDGKVLAVQGDPVSMSDFVVARYGTTPVPPADNDTVPDPFVLGSVTTDKFDFLVESSAITITGLSAPATITTSGTGRFSVGCHQDWSNNTRTITNYSTVCVQHASGTEASPVVHTTLTIGGVSAVFSSNAGDGIPNSFAFVDQVNVSPDSLVISAPVTITGITSQPNVGIVGDGQISIGCNDVWLGSGRISNGQTLCVRLGSSRSPGTTTTTRIDIGGVFADFSVTTRAGGGGDSGSGSGSGSSGGSGGGGGSLDVLLLLGLLAIRLRPRPPCA